MMSHAKAAGHEPATYWEERLRVLRPLTFPFNQLDILIPGKGAGAKRRVAMPQEIGTLPSKMPQADVLIAAFSAFLSRILNIHYFDIPYADTSMPHGAAVSGSPSPEYLPLHIDLGPDNTFEEVCRGLHEELGRLREYGSCLPAVLSDNSGLRTALDDFGKAVSVSVVITESPEDFSSSGDQQMTMVIPRHGAEYMFVYDDSVFDESRIIRLLHHFDVSLRGAISNPSLRISELPLLDEKDEKQLLCDFNDTKMEYPKDKSLQDMFEEQVEKTPNSDAVIFDGKKITYKELNERSNQLAKKLREQGVRPDQIVGLMVDDNSIEMIIGMIGIVKAGGAFLPIDPNHPKDRVDYMLEDSKAGILVTQTELKDAIQFRGETICLETQSLFTGECSNPEKINQPDSLVYVIYTSGSTGKPKGVQIEHSGIVNQIYGLKTRYEFESSLNHILLASITFDPSVQQIFLPLTTGGKLFLVPRSTRQSVKELWEFIVSSRIDIVNTVPSLMSIMLDHAASYGDRHFKYIILAGEVLPKKLYLRLKDFLSADRIINIYGPTEATINATLHECRPEEPSATIPIGKPLMNYNIMILDAQQKLLPIDVPGEICISGAGLARGYLNNAQLTAEKFVPNPFAPGERIYRTGDLGRWTADGNIEFFGRIDHQLKIRGIRVEPGEVEAVLGQHPGVQDTAVIDLDHAGSTRLVAYVVSGQQRNVNVDELSAFLRDKLPDYMVPSAFVLLDSLPLTSNGKVDRQSLPEPNWERHDSSRAFAGPRSSVEEQLAKIWREVLGLKQVGIHDNFFELGGDSLSANSAISRIQGATGASIPLFDFFETPSIASLALRIEQSHGQSPGANLPPVRSYDRGQTAPLSCGQQEIWLSQQLWPDIPVYNETGTIFLKGPIDPAAMEKAVIRLVRRHEILRTFLITENGVPAQAVREEPTIEMRFVDLQSVSVSDREKAALHYATEEARRPFDLSKSPLFRVLLVRLDDPDYRLYIVLHHLVTDGVSIIQVLVPELWVHYEAVRKGMPSPLPQLTLRYSDYATWQRELLHTPMMEEQLAYWKEQLKDLRPLDMSAARTRPPVQTYNGAFRRLGISKELTDALRALGRRAGCTLYMVLLAAFKTLLWRYTHQDDIAIGTIDAGRSRPEMEPLMGYFLNALVLRTNLSGNPSFRTFLKQVRRVALEAYKNKDLPFITLVEALKLPRDTSRHPLYQVAFVMEPPFSVGESGWIVSQYEIQPGTSKFDLTLGLEEREEQIIGRLEYNTDLFDSGTVERMAGHFRRILEEIVADPDQRLSDLALLTDPERNQLLVEWNNTATEYPGDICIHTLFEEQVERTPDAPAVIFGDRQLTYRELNNKANQLGHYLKKQGVGPEVMVGICIERSLEMVIGILGILKAGGAYIPLDPAYPGERLGFMISDTQAPLLLTQRRLVETLPAHGAVLICLDTDWSAVIAGESRDNTTSGARADNLAYVIYTSGSTGNPKGVAIEHHSPVNLVNWARGIYSPDELRGVLASTSICFDLSVFELFATLCNGGTLILAENALQLASLSAAQQVTLLNTVPSAIRELLRLNAIPPSVRVVNLAGEPLSQGIVQRLYQLPVIEKVYDLYGPSETTTYSTFMLRRPGGPCTIGRPLANTQIYLLDTEMQPVPQGVAGELFIGGAGLARGYLNRPEFTAGKFISNPYSEEPEARFYKTGDQARYLPDGNIEFLGRIDNQVKIRGFRIEPGEIEALLGQHPLVKDAIVIAREDQPGDKRLVAYVVLGRKSLISTGKLRNFLKEKLPEYMVPSAFVMMDALPLTPNGKVDRKALPVPEAGRADMNGAFVAPRTPVEEILAGIWCDVLGLKEAGIHDNFFDLGGHSLLATQVMSRLRKALQVDIPLRSLFEMPTIAGLAVRIAQSQAEDTDPEEMDRLLAELEVSASDSVPESGEIGGKRYE